DAGRAQGAFEVVEGGSATRRDERGLDGLGLGLLPVGALGDARHAAGHVASADGLGKVRPSAALPASGSSSPVLRRHTLEALMARTVHCVKLGKDLPGLDYPPVKGEIGK